MRSANSVTDLADDTFALGILSDGTRSVHAIVRPKGEVLDIPDRHPSLREIYADWPRAFDALNELNASEAKGGRQVSDYRFLPLSDYPQIFGAGSNYRQHAAEMHTFNEGEY